jgi:hypothetical protein
LGRASTRIAVTTNRASDIPHPHVLRCERCRETGENYVLEPDTLAPTSKGPGYRAISLERAGRIEAQGA